MSSTRPPWRLATPSFAAVGLLATIVVFLFVRELGTPVYDDAYFFKRFALNAIEHQTLAWNLADGPVHGCTSQAFVVVAIIAALFSHTHYVVVIKGIGAASLMLAGGLLARWGARHAPEGSPAPMLVLLGLGSPLALSTVLSGMETAMTMAVLAGVLVVMLRPGTEPDDGPSPLVAALLTALVYLCRPDVAVVPAVVYAGHAWRATGRLPWRYALMLAASIGVVWAALWAYYGTPLPLSFYMKTAGVQSYGEFMMNAAAEQKQLHVGLTLLFAAPLLWIAGHRRDPINVALLAAVASLWAYHAGFTTEIMGYRGRFYAPGFIPLTMAAMRGHAAFVERGRRGLAVGLLLVLTVVMVIGYRQHWVPSSQDDPLSQVLWPSYAGLGLGAAWVMLASPRIGAHIQGLGLGAITIAAVLGWKPPALSPLRADHQLLRRHDRQVTTTRGIFDVARCLETPTVYHSEMGVTGLVLFRSRVVDLVGLLSDNRLRGESFEQQCQRDQPEAIFLPHRGYRDLNAEIQRSSCIGDYQRVVDRSSSPLHIRRDLVAGFMACARDVQRFRARPKR
ncbi:MAG: hypothetical protein AAF799_04980 [Myxococcota bacterium]